MLCYCGDNDIYHNLNTVKGIYNWYSGALVKCADSEYPSSIKIKFGSSTYIRNNGGDACTFALWLTNANGTAYTKIADISLAAYRNYESELSVNLSEKSLHGQNLYLQVSGDNGYIVLRNRVQIEIGFSAYDYAITNKTPTGGSCTVSKTRAVPGTTITLSPTANTGYEYAGFWLAGVLKTGKTFTMPSNDVTVEAKFTKINYSVNVTQKTGGTCTASRSTANYGDTVTLNIVTSTGYTYQGFNLNGTNKTGTSFTMPAGKADVYARFTRNSYTVSLSSQTGGSCTASKTSAGYGDTITLTPTAQAGYTYAGFTLDGTAMAGTTFSMPNGNVTVVALFSRNGYGITLAANPAEGGAVTADKTNTYYGDTVTLSQTPAAGYYFNGWSTNPAVTVDNQNKFTMPNQAITVTANYLHRSTGSLNLSSMTGGGTAVLTIDSESTEYTHKYTLSFGTGMETEETAVAAGVSSVNIPIPENWSDQIPNATSKGSGTLVLKTYKGQTEIGSYTITGLTYNVPLTVVPILTDPVTAVVRTVDGVTFADVDETIGGETIVHYVQSHCGVEVIASATGQRSATIENIQVKIGNYNTSRYQTVQEGDSVDFFSSLLFIAGETTITVTATDSRGRTTTKTVTITVEEYNNPQGTLTVKRVDVNRDEDPNGEYAVYTKTNTFSEIGTNALTVTIDCGTLGSETNPPASGDLLPSSRQQFQEIREYTVSLILEDAFERTVISARLPSGHYTIFVTADGNGIAFMKAVTKTPTSPKTSVLEIADTTQVYIGNDTLEDYIRNIVQNM